MHTTLITLPLVVLTSVASRRHLISSTHRQTDRVPTDWQTAAVHSSLYSSISLLTPQSAPINLHGILRSLIRARAVWQTQRGTSVTFLQSSRWSLCHLSQSSISAYETNTPRWSHKFHLHLCTNWCLQIFVLSTYTSRLEHSVCWSPSQVLVVCKRVSYLVD